MKELIKSIRASANMNQEEFAKELGTTVASINRWENGHVVPSNLAVKSFYDFCENNFIDIPNGLL